MKEPINFPDTLEVQKELIAQLQKLLRKEIDGKADSERLEELSSAIESATEALNNLTKHFQGK